MKWIDEYIKYLNLQNNEDSNILKNNQKDRFRIPQLYFTNAVDKNIASFEDLSFGKMGIIDKSNNGTFSSLSEFNNQKVYYGHQV